MISEKQKQKIKEFMAPHILKSEGKVFTEEQWELNFIKNYGDQKQIGDNENFCLYKESDEFIYIQEYIFSNKKQSIRAFDFFRSTKKCVLCHVHISNIEILNILMRNEFRITKIEGTQYLLERRKKNEFITK